MQIRKLHIPNKRWHWVVGSLVILLVVAILLVGFLGGVIGGGVSDPRPEPTVETTPAVRPGERTVDQVTDPTYGPTPTPTPRPIAGLNEAGIPVEAETVTVPIRVDPGSGNMATVRVTIPHVDLNFLKPRFPVSEQIGPLGDYPFRPRTNSLIRRSIMSRHGSQFPSWLGDNGSPHGSYWQE